MFNLPPTFQADDRVDEETRGARFIPASVLTNTHSNKGTAEKRVKEKSSYRKLIANLQETYPDLSQVKFTQCFILEAK